MEFFDSNEKQLSPPEIITRVANAQSTKEMPLQTILAAFASEASLPNTDLDLIGNTVFITHYDKTKTKAVGRALNVDTGKNFIFNGQEYMRRLYKRGVRRYSAWFDQSSFEMTFEVLKKRPVTTETDVKFVKTSTGKTGVLIKLDGELI
jgi:hypothetical protein